MKVRAKWNVKDAAGWHRTGSVFETEEDLGNAVEILDKPKPAEKPAEAPAVKQEPAEKEAPAAREAVSAARRPANRKKAGR